MAKTTREKPQSPPKTGPTGPILVEESSQEAEIQAEEEPEQEQTETESPATAPPDPRRIPPSQRMEGPEFWAFLQQYPVPQDLDLYIYRLFPVVKSLPPAGWNSNQKPPTYCEKVKGLITQQTGEVADYEWLRNVRGSGNYHLRVVERALKRTQNRQICECILEINEYDTHMPVLNDWCELVPNASGNQWIIQRLIQDKVIKRTPEGGLVAAVVPSENSTAANDPGAMLTQTVNLAKDLAQTMRPKDTAPGFTGKDIVDLIGKTQVANDPQKIIDAATSLIQMTKPPENKEGSVLITLLLAQLKEQSTEAAAARAREFELMKDMLNKANTPPPAPPAPPDPVATIEAQAKAYVTLREAFGGGDAAAAQSRMNGWQEFLKEPLVGFMDLLKPFAQVGAAIFAAKAQQSAQQNAAAAPKAPTAPPTSPAVTQGQQQPAPTPPGQPQQQTTPQPAQETQQPMPPAPNPVLIVLNAALMHVDFTLRDYFANELPGSDFAAWFCDTAIPLPAPYNLMQESVIGAEALKKLQQFTATDPQGKTLDAPEAGKNLLIAAYKANPAIWAKIVTSPDKEPKFSKFLDEFLAYNPEGEPAPVAAAKGAKRP